MEHAAALGPGVKVDAKSGPSWGEGEQAGAPDVAPSFYPAIDWRGALSMLGQEAASACAKETPPGSRGTASSCLRGRWLRSEKLSATGDAY